MDVYERISRLKSDFTGRGSVVDEAAELLPRIVEESFDALRTYSGGEEHPVAHIAAYLCRQHGWHPVNGQHLIAERLGRLAFSFAQSRNFLRSRWEGLSPKLLWEASTPSGREDFVKEVLDSDLNSGYCMHHLCEMLRSLSS